MGSGAGAQNPQLNIVSFSETFNLYYTSRFSAKTLDKIDDFIEHFEKYNLFGDPLKNIQLGLVKYRRRGKCLIITKTKKLLSCTLELTSYGMLI
jgi:hypothetical protein